MIRSSILKIGYGNMAGLVLMAMSLVLGTSMVSSAQYNPLGPGTISQIVPGSVGDILSQNLLSGSSGTANSAVYNTICNIFNTIKNVIFILGLTLMVLGGAIYAGANLMPSQSRGSFQGYGMAMVVGGIIGVAIAVAAPFILNTIISAAGPNSPLASTSIGGVIVTGSQAITPGICGNVGGGVGGLF